jgi:TonB-linked SusC/RagA family outer membrane protein
MTNNCKGIILLLMLLFHTAVRAQELSDPIITGTVMNQKGGFLEGVTVDVKQVNGKGAYHTITDIKGNFRLPGLKAGETYDFTFSFVGYDNNVIRAFKVREGNGNSILVRLHETGASLNEVVVIGYGTQNKKDVTTSIASLKAEDVNNYPATGLDKALTGKLAGVQVLQPAGAPGAGISIMIRGRGTITAGSDPLYVIDGVPLSDNDINGPGIKVNPLNAININDIETIDVLKDASAAAIYGSRGSNGVIVITTKHGKKDKLSVSFNSYIGTQEVTKKIPMLDAYQYAQLIYDAHNNTYFDLLADKNLTGAATDDNATRLSKLLGAPGSTSQAYLLPPDIFPYLNNQQGLTNTNWQEQIFRKAPQQSYSLSVSGGSDNIRYYVSGNYLNQRGIVINSGYKKYGGRVNVDASYRKLRMGVSVNYNYAIYDNQQTEGRFNGNLENIISGAMVAAPFFPVYNSNGSYNFDQFKWQYAQSQLINPVALAMLKTDNTYENKILSNVFAEYELIKDIKYKLSFGTDITNSNRNAFRPSTLPNILTLTTPSIPAGNYRNSQITNWVVENTLSWNKRLGSHSIRAIAGFTAQREKSQASNISATGYSNDLIKSLNAATSITGWSSAINEWSLMSTLARVQYSFKERYMLSAAIRADGSSRFGPRNKWGYFPSASVGWNIGDEKFMQPIKFISSLKLRASFGVIGNFQIGNYGYLASLAESNYIFGPQGGTSLSSGLYQSTPGNANLGWEKTSAINIGTDIGLFNEQLHATIDLYNNNTNHLLLNVPVPQSSGYSTNLVNIGKVNNKGIEITLSSNNKLGAFRLTNNINYSVNRNKVVDLGGVNSIITQAQSVIYFITQVGKPIGNYYTLVKTGVYKNQAEIDDPKNAKVAGAKPGDFKYKDVSGDGSIDGSSDRDITGNYMPKFTYGFSTKLQYKIFDLGGSLQGLYGNTIANINKRHMDATESYANNTTNALSRWRSPDDPGNGIIARANRSQRGLNATISTYHLEDGSYLRIRDITLGISIPAKYIGKAGLTGVRIYFTAQNPFTFTKYSSYNPEVSIDDNPLTPGIDYGTYPLAKAFFAGVNVNF